MSSTERRKGRRVRLADGDGPASGISSAREELIRLYIGAGLQVTPCKGKKPLRGWRVTSDDVDAILDAFRRHPEANIGLAMGTEIQPGEFVMALDLDPRNGSKRAERQLASRLNLRLDYDNPESAVQFTGGGGRHILFTLPFIPKNGPIGPDYPGVEIVSDGKGIVVEDSIHPQTRQEYVWIFPPWRKISTAPPKLSSLIWDRRGRSGSYAASARPDGSRIGDITLLTAQTIDRFPVEKVGTRHNQMVRAVGSLLGQGYSPDIVQRVRSRSKISW